MICTLIYYEDGKKPPVVTGCESYKIAIDLLTKKQAGYTPISNAQILVDYSNVEIYKTKFEELYDIMKNNFLGSLGVKSKNSVDKITI